MTKPILLLTCAALLAACTGPANPAASPNGGNGTTTPITGGVLTDAQVDAMVACVKDKPGGSVFVTGWTQYKSHPQNVKEAMTPAVKSQAQSLGCL